MKILDLEGMASFESMRRACEEATKLGEPVILRNWRRDFVVQPDSNPHHIYHDAFPEYGARHSGSNEDGESLMAVALRNKHSLA